MLKYYVKMRLSNEIISNIKTSWNLLRFLHIRILVVLSNQEIEKRLRDLQTNQGKV